MSTSYVYDSDGNRVKKLTGSTGSLYWYMTPGIIGESDLSGNLKSEYVFFNGERVARRDYPSGTVAYYFSDHLKTASVVTDSVGNIKSESDYYPWGGELQFTANDSNHYKFTGKERDTETGLDYFGARYYSNGIGRFITPDWAAKAAAVPYAEFADPQTLNLYTYVRNIPTSLVDGDGHSMGALSNEGFEGFESFWDDMDRGSGTFALNAQKQAQQQSQNQQLAQVEEPDLEQDELDARPQAEAERALKPVEPDKPEPNTFDWTHPGPLSDDIAKTFSGGRYAKVVIGKDGFSTDQAVYRVYGGSSGPEGRDGTFYALLPQSGGLQSQIDLALRPEWGNTAENVVCVYLKPGSVVYVGTAASQGGIWVGGTPQIYVPK